MDLEDILKIDSVYKMLGVFAVLLAWGKFTGDMRPFYAFIAMLTLVFVMYAANYIIGKEKS